MGTLRVLSGVGNKAAAAFLVTVGKTNILLDAGCFVASGADKAYALDAIVLSHCHHDHTEALATWVLNQETEHNKPLVYATEATWNAIALSPSERAHLIDRYRKLPASGAVEIAGVPALLGRSGHAPGGVWVHFPQGSGLTYMGDWSSESILIPFDAPPPADLLVTDASHALRDQTLDAQTKALASAVSRGAVLPVPSHGRGPEMALRLSSLGVSVRVCPSVAEDISEVLYCQGNSIPFQLRKRLEAIGQSVIYPNEMKNSDVYIVRDSRLDAVRDRNVLITGFASPLSLSHELLQTGLARSLPWNAHPPLRDTLDLIARTAPKSVVLAFCERELLEGYEAYIKGRINWATSIPF